MKTCIICNDTKQFEYFAIRGKYRLNGYKACRNKKQHDKYDSDNDNIDFEFRSFQQYTLSQTELDLIRQYSNIPENKPNN